MSNNNYNTTPGYGFGGYYPGMTYAPVHQPKMTQPLTAEQMKALAVTGGEFNLKVDPNDILRSQCTHKRDGKYTIRANNDGTVTCDICNATFTLTDLDPEDLQHAVNVIVNHLQTIKTMYVDMPESYAQDYFKMIPLLLKMPAFGKVALSNFRQYESGNPLAPAGNQPAGFAMYNQMINSNPYNPAAFGAPMGGFNQPFGGQPMMPQPQAPAPFGQNPFVAQPQAPMGMYNPQMQPMAQPQAPMGGYAQPPVTPQAPVAASPAPTAPMNGQPVVTEKAFTV